MLDLSKVEAGRMDFVTAPIDLPTLADEALALVRPDAERKRSPSAPQGAAVQ